jgi:nitroreductase
MNSVKENNFLSLASKRYSVRNFLNKTIEEEKLVSVLEAGRIAPSAANFQPWHFIVVRDRATIKKVGEAYPRPWFLEAPVVIIVCGDHEKSWKRGDGKDFTDVDIAITVDHMTLAAAEAGLGTCWVCNFDAKKISSFFNLPAAIEPIVLLPLGYPGESTDQASRHIIRKNLDSIVHWEKF